MPTNSELFSVSKLTQIASLETDYTVIFHNWIVRDTASYRPGMHMKRGTQCGGKFVELIDNANKHTFLLIALQVSTELVKCGLLDHTLPCLL